MALFWPITTTILSCVVVAVVWWLYGVHRNLISLPPEARRLSGESWTEEELRSLWEKFEGEEHDFTKYLPPKQNRRYVVMGGSGQCSFFLELDS